jgi:mono/diheme cytochrome c family protein
MRYLAHLAIIILVPFIISFQNCGQPEHGERVLMSLSYSSPPTFAQIDQNIFQSKCVECHTPSDTPDLTSYAGLMASAVIVPGSPSTSQLYLRVANHEMPPTEPLSDTDIRAVYDWILAGASDSNLSPPLAPSVLQATAASAAQINLSWNDNSSDEAGFKIERSASANGPFSVIASVASNMKTYADLNLAAATTYFYRVKASNSAGDSAYTNTVSATTQNAPVNPPLSPTNMVLAVASPTQINISWQDKSSDESGFKVERSANAGGPFAVVGTVGAGVTTYQNTGLAPSTTYYYRVYSYNSAGNSAPTTAANATTTNLATFAALNANIFQPKCVSCHNSKKAGGGYDMSSYNGVLTSVIKFNSAASVLYQQVADGSMPKVGADLNTTELNAIKTWIDGGALNN